MTEEELTGQKSQHNAKVKKTTQELLLEAVSTSYHPAVGLLWNPKNFTCTIISFNTIIPQGEIIIPTL